MHTQERENIQTDVSLQDRQRHNYDADVWKKFLEITEDKTF